MLQCEEGWSYIAEWIGVPLSHILQAVGVHPQARYVVYFSIDPDWWDSIDMADALHPQTFLAYGMNGDELPVGNGGPLRLRLPRQLGYKSVKFVTHLTVTDNLKEFGKGLGSASPEGRLCLVRRHLTGSFQAAAHLGRGWMTRKTKTMRHLRCRCDPKESIFFKRFLHLRAVRNGVPWCPQAGFIL